MTGNEEARATDGDLVSAPNTPSRFTARVASTSSTGLPEPNLVWKDTVLVRACESSKTIRCQQSRALDGSLTHRPSTLWAA
jgi:hypothetical protein